MTRLEEVASPNGSLRILRGVRLVGFTCRALSGEWEAHWVDSRGVHHSRPANTSTDAARVLRDALEEHRNV